MRRREFIRIIGTASAAVIVAPVIPSVSKASTRNCTGTARHLPRYRIYGNKKLGCSGFDFPDDPDIIENGRFMPSI